ncbi:MAG: UDP-N-acetylglucosamine 1-carboxyvinyltransferase [Defluviitaleaceae bacterium]|nr:UDP-N-acetylglucosamine 1-carboxyvinyltransferase [Defluviitaleaceae bacterium]
MFQYRIRGGNRLLGELKIGGAKNAALPILAAACLNESETIIENCPRISDILDTIEILNRVGCETEFEGNTLKVRADRKLNCEIPAEIAEKMRSSVLFMGAFLARCGRAILPAPGGCNLGARAIDLHIKGLIAMGAKIHEENGKIFCETDGLTGAKIKLSFASVGATENLMLAAVRARGETIIENAAREPEIIDLSDFLKKIGADIRGAGTGTIVIRGKKSLSKPVLHKVIFDRIVAGTHLVAAAMTGGEICLKNVRPFDLMPVAGCLKEMGCFLRSEGGDIYLRAPERLRALPRIVTRVHPGFPTDMQAQFVAALAIAEGKSEVVETVFENRCSHVGELRKMGANIRLTADKRTFLISGAASLRGATVAAHDLRCGAALILAALAADGESIVQNARFVERGYSGIENDLYSLGADISLENTPVRDII